jgi:CheY-like chemotaxis protein
MDTKKRILVVDDDDQIAKMYITHLEIKGFSTRRVNNGEDALSATIDYKPDLILLDVMMPKISGFDVLDILKNTEQTKDIPIIMLTALSASEDIDRANQLGANEYLEKSSTDLPTIILKINEILDKKPS